MGRKESNQTNKQKQYTLSIQLHPDCENYKKGKNFLKINFIATLSNYIIKLQYYATVTWGKRLFYCHIMHLVNVLKL